MRTPVLTFIPHANHSAVNIQRHFASECKRYVTVTVCEVRHTQCPVVNQLAGRGHAVRAYKHVKAVRSAVNAGERSGKLPIVVDL